MGAMVTKGAKSTVLTVLAVAAIVVGSLAGPIATGSAADEACADVEVVFARSTNEPPAVGATGQVFVDALTAKLPGESVGVYGVNYPASLNFGQAVDGIADASDRIQLVAASCPATKIVLGGYSQGTAVAGYTTSSVVPAGYVLPAGVSGPMPAGIASHVAAVALFGTPDDWFLNLVAHETPPITIGEPYTAKTVQLCAMADPVCFPGGLSRGANSSYKDNGMASQAADFVVRQLEVNAPSAAMIQTAGELGAN